MSLEELEKRIRVLEDIEAIKQLKARYCAYADAGFDADGVAGLFTEDGVWEGSYGTFWGREEIHGHFIKTRQVLSFAIHMVMNPIIEVSGDTARGTWYLFNPCTFAEENRAVWNAARYDEEYARVDEEWKFKSLKLTRFFRTPFDEGWAKSKVL